jgi:short-subunit dehydrogenase
MRKLTDTTVVITGASSGNGRAAALAFARRGARLALAARGAALLDVAKECEAVGAKAVAVPTDVTDVAAVRRLASAASNQLGPIRVWINNAGVGAVGSFTDTPIEAHRRVIETNLLGYLNGAHAVLPYFFNEGEGILINNISLGAWSPAPFAVAYATSKYGVLGFSESLRAEVAGWSRIHICDVFPSFMDTPGIQHGANYTGRVLKPAPPVYDPQRVADAFVSLAMRPRPAVVIGAPARLSKFAHTLAPQLTGWLGSAVLRLYLRQAEPAPVTEGNLFQPAAGPGATRGGWQKLNRPLGGVVLGVTCVVTVGTLLTAVGVGR